MAAISSNFDSNGLRAPCGAGCGLWVLSLSLEFLNGVKPQDGRIIKIWL